SWTLADYLFLSVSVLGWWALVRRQNGRAHLVWAVASLAATVVIWFSWATGAPLAVLGPPIVVMLVLPGFLILELAAAETALRLDLLERVPLLFGLSLTVWTVLGAAAYRGRWTADGVIGAILFGGVVGLP